jgi:hypothetical protein
MEHVCDENSEKCQECSRHTGRVFEKDRKDGRVFAADNFVHTEVVSEFEVDLKCPTGTMEMVPKKSGSV